MTDSQLDPHSLAGQLLQSAELDVPSESGLRKTAQALGVPLAALGGALSSGQTAFAKTAFAKTALAKGASVASSSNAIPQLSVIGAQNVAGQSAVATAAAAATKTTAVAAGATTTSATTSAGLQALLATKTGLLLGKILGVSAVLGTTTVATLAVVEKDNGAFIQPSPALPSPALPSPALPSPSAPSPRPQERLNPVGQQLEVVTPAEETPQADLRSLAPPQPSHRPKARPTIRNSAERVHDAAPSAKLRTPTAATTQDRLSTSDLQQELTQLARARRALRQGDASHCLELLQDYRKRFPRGVLGSESSVLRLEALAAHGRIREARQGARAFANNSPHSPHLPRLQKLGLLPDDKSESP